MEQPVLPIPFPPSPRFPPHRTIDFGHWCGAIVRDLDCKTRVLMVADGLNFGTSAFGLAEAVSIVKSAATTDHDIEVVTAHTNSDPDADVEDFRFDGTHDFDGDTRTIHEYQEIWLFAYTPASADAGMTGSELDELTTFMNNGGGVLAMGDHDNLGAYMCGEVPRVKSMRQWYSGIAPPGTTADRIDTNVSAPYADPQFDLQSDNIPQRIYPTWYGRAEAAEPHPLLSFAGGTVTYLPDHPHEGRCVVPDTLEAAQWPTDGAGVQVPPQIVAYGVSGGPGFDVSKPSVTPTLFGVIGAYDGHQTNVGRIVVDSTWHHWVNINLNGAGATPTGALETNGLYDSVGNPTPEYEQIQAYYKNIAGWLEPNRIRLCRIYMYIPCLRWEWPLFQEIDLRAPMTLRETLRIGKLAFATTTRLFGAARASEVVRELVANDDATAPKLELLFAMDQNERDLPEIPAFLDETAFSAAVLGGAILNFAKAIPQNPHDGVAALREKMRDKKSKRLRPEPLAELVTQGARKGLSQLFEALEGAAKPLDRLCRLMR